MNKLESRCCNCFHSEIVGTLKKSGSFLVTIYKLKKCRNFVRKLNCGIVIFVLFGWLPASSFGLFQVIKIDVDRPILLSGANIPKASE